ncbi:MAG: hypothetical protein A3J97_15685 [Spirochaetes bacterium RIFOXYC1_FULL_54_7]|nr:MAG: hypothetical protein A3J97_15685 [Spirochaetes bacterium RIFOXYC1_FULL_54_7]
MISEVEDLLRMTGFEQIRVTPIDHSRSFMREWIPGMDITEYAVSASIEAVKPFRDGSKGLTGIRVAKSPGSSGSGCCGGPATTGVEACCALDAKEKARGKAGCGCNSPAPGPEKTKVTCC